MNQDQTSITTLDEQVLREFLRLADEEGTVKPVDLNQAPLKQHLSQAFLDVFGSKKND